MVIMACPETGCLGTYSAKVGSKEEDMIIRFARWMTPCLDLGVTIFFNVKYLGNGTTYSYIYNGKLMKVNDLSNGAMFSDLEIGITVWGYIIIRRWIYN